MEKFIDFMLEQDFQAALPDNMYVYPVDSAVALPESWAAYATVAPKPLRRSTAEEIAANRSDVAARVAGHHQPVTTSAVPTGRRTAGAPWRSPRCRWPRSSLFFVYPVAGHARPRASGPTARFDPGAVRRGARPAARPPGAVVHACGRPGWPPRSSVVAGLPGRVRAAPAALPRPRPAAGARRGAVRAADRGGRRRLPAADRPVGTARRARPRRHGRRDRRGAGVLQHQRRGAHRRRVLGGDRPAPRGGRRGARGQPVAGAPHGHAARAAARASSRRPASSSCSAPPRSASC